MASTQVSARLPQEWAGAVEEFLKRESARLRGSGRKANKNRITIELWGAALIKAKLLPAQKER